MRWVVLVVVACSDCPRWGLGTEQCIITLRKPPLPKPLTAEQLRRLAENQPLQAAPDTGRGEKQNLFKIMARRRRWSRGSSGRSSCRRFFRRSSTGRLRGGFQRGDVAVCLSNRPSRRSKRGDGVAALISGYLDWSPGCYAARHAYFVFKRDREVITGLQAGMIQVGRILPE